MATVPVAAFSLRKGPAQCRHRPAAEGKGPHSAALGKSCSPDKTAECFGLFGDGIPGLCGYILNF